MSHLPRSTRRHFLSLMGATATSSIFLKGCLGNPPSDSPTAPVNTVVSADQPKPETTKIKLGYIPIVESAPIIIAQEKRFFAKHGMTEVEVSKQASWGAARDNVVIGSQGGGIDGGMWQMPMPYYITEGRITTNNQKVPMYVLLQLITHGNGIAIAGKHKGKGLTTKFAGGAKALFSNLKSAGTKFKAAYTFPGANQELWIRYWLAANGIDPDRDVELKIIPPAQMVADLKAGSIDGFCVGEPWNFRAAYEGVGFTVATDREIWDGHPGKVLGVREDWAIAYPNTHIALVKALLEACVYCADPRHTEEIRELIARKEYVGTKKEYIHLGSPELNTCNLETPMREYAHHQFFGATVNRPSRTEHLWLAAQMARWGEVPFPRNWVEVAERVCQVGVFSTAAREIGLSEITYSKGAIHLFDGVSFSADNPIEYLHTLHIERNFTLAEIPLTAG